MARLINDETIMIHVPRAGGTYFREILCALGVPNFEIGNCTDNLYDYKHNSLDMVIEKNPHLKDNHSIGMVREPLSWYQSIWSFSKNNSHFPQKLQCVDSAKNHWMAPVWSDDFRQFVWNICEYYPNGIATQRFNMMLRGVTTIGRYEDLIELILALTGRSRFDVNEAAKKVMKDMTYKQNPLRDSIEPDLKLRITQIEYDIYERFYPEFLPPR